MNKSFVNTTLRLQNLIQLSVNRPKELDSLRAIPVISLGEHDMFSDVFTLFDCAESNDVPNTWIRLLVSMSHAHATANANIEASEFTILIDDGDEA